MANVQVRHQLQYRATDDVVWTNYGASTVDNSEIVTGLLPDIGYDFRVISSNEAAASISPPVHFTTTLGNAGGIASALARLSGSSTAGAKATLVAMPQLALAGTAAYAYTATYTARVTIGVVQGGLIIADAWVDGVQVTTDGAGAAPISATTLVAAAVGRPSGTGTGTASPVLRALATTRHTGTAAAVADATHTALGAPKLIAAGTGTVGQTTLIAAAVATLNGQVGGTARGDVFQIQHWSTTHKFSNITLSGNQATESATLDDSAVYASSNVTTGKYYWELQISCATPAQITVGIGNINASVASYAYVGSNSDSLGWLMSLGTVQVNQANIVTGWPTFASGDTVGFAMDLTASTPVLWARVGSGGWFGNTSGGNPATGVNGLPIPASVRAAGIAPGCTLNAVGDFVVGSFAAASWLFSAPAGFVSFDTIHTPQPPASLSAATVLSTSLQLSWASS